MRRTLALATLCVLLLATAGATAVGAKQPDTPQEGKSSVYHFDIPATDAHGPGKLMIDLKQKQFTFTGDGFVPGKTYWVWCEASGPHTLGSVTANPAGHVAVTGRLSDTVNWGTVTTASIFSVTLNVKPTLDTTRNIWTFGLTATWSGGVAPVTVGYSIKQNGVTLDDSVKTTTGSGSATSFILFEGHFPVGAGTIVYSVTLTDSLQHTAGDSKTFTV